MNGEISSWLILLPAMIGVGGTLIATIAAQIVQMRLKAREIRATANAEFRVRATTAYVRLYEQACVTSSILERYFATNARNDLEGVNTKLIELQDEVRRQLIWFTNDDTDKWSVKLIAANNEEETYAAMMELMSLLRKELRALHLMK